MLMSPDSSYSPSSSSGPQSGVLSKATSVLMVAPSSATSMSVSSQNHRQIISTPISSTVMMAPLNLQKYECIGDQSHHHAQEHAHSRPTAIATAVIRVQVPECNTNGMMRHPGSSPPSPTMVSVSTNNGNGLHSPFMVPQPTLYSNVIVMNQRPKPQVETSACQSSPDYAKSYPVMEPTVASSSSHLKGEPELNIGMLQPYARGPRWSVKVIWQISTSSISWGRGPPHYIFNWDYKVAAVHFTFRMPPSRSFLNRISGQTKVVKAVDEMIRVFTFIVALKSLSLVESESLSVVGFGKIAFHSHCQKR